MKFRSKPGARSASLVAFVALAATAALPGVATASTARAAAAADEGKVTVVHAVPDLIVDIYANHDLLLEDFAPGTITPAVDLPAGEYLIEVTPADADDVVLSATVPVDDETDAAGVAYLDEEGAPTLGLFGNDMSAIGEKRARVSVRHTAAAPEVDVRVKRPGGEWKMVTTDLANGEQATGSFKARKYRFDVVLAGTETRVLGPVAVELERRTHYFVYAWGSAADESLALNLSSRRLPVAR